MSQRYYWEFDKERGCNIFDRKQPGDQYTGAGKVAWAADTDFAELMCWFLRTEDDASRVETGRAFE
jgi:hypothetical protein